MLRQLYSKGANFFWTFLRITGFRTCILINFFCFLVSDYFGCSPEDTRSLHLVIDESGNNGLTFCISICCNWKWSIGQWLNPWPLNRCNLLKSWSFGMIQRRHVLHVKEFQNNRSLVELQFWGVCSVHWKKKKTVEKYMMLKHLSDK